jgi:integrase
MHRIYDPALKPDRRLIELPTMPALIRYHDAYAGAWRTIRAPRTEDVWILHLNGTERPLDFRLFPESVRWILRHLFAAALVKYAPTTAAGIFDILVWLVDNLGSEIILRPLNLEPLELRQFWLQFILPELIEVGHPALPLKFYFKFLCKNGVGRLSPGDEKFISKLPGPKADLYASVRTNEVFLSNLEQLAIVNHLDDMSEAARRGTLPRDALRDACLLVASFQYAMRPIQLAKVRRNDVTVRPSIAGDDPIVHVRFSIEKQRSSKKRTPVTHKIKREWAILYVRYYAAIAPEQSRPGKFFFELDPAETSFAIKRILSGILDRSRSANDLRHTAAQRLVDRGASHEELQRFMGHNNPRTGLVYFKETANQAECLNKALASSKIYSEISIIGRDKMIDESRLKAMSADQQIGGVPHGIPIAGIGACEVGQSLCTKNPVLSCYGCRKFMPVRSTRIHREVIEMLRAVVRRFSDVSPTSSAFAQLTYAIAAVERLIADEDNA